MPPRLPDDYVAKAMQDAMQFQGCWDAGTSGSLAAHVHRLIREREELVGTIQDLEQRNAELRAAASARLGASAAAQAEAATLPGDLPASLRESLDGWTVREAQPQPPFTVEITRVGASMSDEALEKAWDAVTRKRDALKQARPCRRCMPDLVGIAGRAGAGKNLAASMIPEATILHFADPIYDMLAVMLGMSVDELRERDTKESVIPWLGKSPRQLLQTLGTEWGRQSVRDDLWLVLAEKRLEQAEGGGPVVFADLRFDNEAQWIRRRGGQVWEIMREGTDAAAGHASEAGISPRLVDKTFWNRGTPEQLRADVLAACGG